MKTSKDLIKEHIARLEAVMKLFRGNNSDAISALDEAKKALSDKELPADDGRELYEPAVYNALASINSSPVTSKINNVLYHAVSDALEELKIILEML